jgi:hypothetical protein
LACSARCSWGVLNTAIAALSVAAVSRGLLAFARSAASWSSRCSGCGGGHIYTVALKKLTTPTTRGIAFSVQ